MIEKYIGLLGSGGQADETESYHSKDRTLFRAVHPEYITAENEIEINNPDEEHKDVPVIAAVGAPGLKREMTEAWPGVHFETIIAKEAYVDESSEIGEGSVIAPRAVITTNVKIGKHVLVNVGSTISHDCEIGDFTSVSPGVHIGGNVIIGEGAFIGIGAVVSHNIHIASGVVIGAGAVVTKSIETENSVVVGVPAQIIKVNESWLREL